MGQAGLTFGRDDEAQVLWDGSEIRTKAVVLLASVALHGALIAVVVLTARFFSSLNETESQPRPLVVSIEFVELQKVPDETLPQTPDAVAQEDGNQDEAQTESLKEREETSKIENKTSTDDASVFLQALPERVKLDGFFATITCPSFIDPADLDLVERCQSRRKMDISEPLSHGQAVAVRSIAKKQRKNAIKNGWNVAAVELTPAQKVREAESQMSAPSAEIFGPWPWE